MLSVSEVAEDAMAEGSSDYKVNKIISVYLFFHLLFSSGKDQTYSATS